VAIMAGFALIYRILGFGLLQFKLLCRRQQWPPRCNSRVPDWFHWEKRLVSPWYQFHCWCCKSSSPIHIVMQTWRTAQFNVLEKR
jgi:hypothetical protein